MTRPCRAFEQMHDVMSALAKPCHDAASHAHVGQETHASRQLGGKDFLLGQPGRVLERLLNIVPLEARIRSEYVIDRRTTRDLIHDYRDRIPAGGRIGEP